MWSKYRLFLIGLFPWIIIGMIGCNPLNPSGWAVSSGNPSIQELQQNPSQGSTVYLTGKVINTAPFLGSGAYQLQDTTGTIWVISQKPLPTQGREVLIKGKVEYQSVPIAGQELGEVYLVELEQLENKASVTPAPPSPSVVTPSPIQVKPTPKPVDDLFLPHKRYEK